MSTNLQNDSYQHATMHHIKTNIFYCIQNEKHISWVYCNTLYKIVILIDPPVINQDIITIIEDIHPMHLFIMLTSCEHNKKSYTKEWLKLYNFTVHTPYSSMDPVITPYETSYISNKKYTILIPNTAIPLMDILGTSYNDYYRLFIYIFPYFFTGSALQNGSMRNTMPAKIIKDYLKQLNANTIMCPSLGPINVLSNNTKKHNINNLLSPTTMCHFDNM